MIPDAVWAQIAELGRNRKRGTPYRFLCVPCMDILADILELDDCDVRLKFQGKVLHA